MSVLDIAPLKSAFQAIEKEIVTGAFEFKDLIYPSQSYKVGSDSTKNGEWRAAFADFRNALDSIVNAHSRGLVVDSENRQQAIATQLLKQERKQRETCPCPQQDVPRDVDRYSETSTSVRTWQPSEPNYVEKLFPQLMSDSRREQWREVVAERRARRAERTRRFFRLGRR